MDNNINLAPRSIPEEFSLICAESNKTWEGRRHSQGNDLAKSWPLLYLLFQEVERLGIQELDNRFYDMMQENYALLNNHGPVVKNSLLTMMHIFSGGEVDVSKLLKAPPAFSLSHTARTDFAKEDQQYVKDFIKAKHGPNPSMLKLANVMNLMEFDPSNILLGLHPGTYPLRSSDYENTVMYFDDWFNPFISGNYELPTETMAGEMILHHVDVEKLGLNTPIYQPLFGTKALFTLEYQSPGNYLFRTMLTRASEKEAFLTHTLKIRLIKDERLGTRVASINEINDGHYNTLTLSCDDMFDRGQDFIWFNGNKNSVKLETKLPLPAAYKVRGRLLQNVICYNNVEHAYHYGTRNNIPTGIVRMGLEHILKIARVDNVYVGGYTSHEDRIKQLDNIYQQLVKYNVIHSPEANDSYNVGNDSLLIETYPTEIKGVSNVELGWLPRVDSMPSWMRHAYRIVLSVQADSEGQKVVDFTIKAVDVASDTVCVFTPACIECVSSTIARVFENWCEALAQLPARSGRPPCNMTGM